MKTFALVLLWGVLSFWPAGYSIGRGYSFRPWRINRMFGRLLCKFEGMKRLLLVVLMLLPLACRESQTLGLLEYRILASKPGFTVSYTDDRLRPQEQNVDDVVWSVNFPTLTGTAASLTALGNKLDQELTGEIWFQGVKLASDTESGDLPFVNVVAPL